MIINDSVLNNLTEQAKESPRLRKNFDLRNSEKDNSQRMLNAVEPGTVIPIHRHSNTSTTLIVLRGSIRHNIFDSHGNLDKSIILSSDSEIKVIQIEAGKWHNLESLESGTIIFEAKDGPWETYQQLIDTI